MLLYFIFILFSCLFIVAWLWRRHIKPYFAQKALQHFFQSHPQGNLIATSMQFLNKLYAPINGTYISQQERKRLKLEEDAFTYGEIDFITFMLIFSKIKVEDQEIFYDLGSGTGKVVFTVALWGSFSKVYGIELLPGLHEIASNQLEQAKIFLADDERMSKLQSIQFLQGDFKNIDFSDADILFINATCLSHPTWVLLLEKFSKLRTGARIIITTKKIPLKEFSLIYHDTILMSWGLNSINIYIKN